MKLTKMQCIIIQWVIKKANGTHCAHITAKGYEQVDGEHYDEHSIGAPVIG